MKKIIRVAVFAAVPMLAALSTQAQVTFGPRVGLNASYLSYDYEDNDDTPDSKLLPGAQIGLGLNAQFGNLALQPALLFAMKGDKVEESGSDSGVKYEAKETLRLSYAEIPVNLVYSTKGADGGFQVFAGPYVAFGLSGKIKNEASVTFNGRTETKKEEAHVEFANEYGDDEDKYFARGLDYGLNAGLGYKVGGVQVQLGYGLGLGNLIPKIDGEEPEVKIRNRNLQLSFSYFFE